MNSRLLFDHHHLLRWIPAFKLLSDPLVLSFDAGRAVHSGSVRACSLRTAACFTENPVSTCPEITSVVFSAIGVQSRWAGALGLMRALRSDQPLKCCKRQTMWEKRMTCSIRNSGTQEDNWVPNVNSDFCACKYTVCLWKPCPCRCWSMIKSQGVSSAITSTLVSLFLACRCTTLLMVVHLCVSLLPSAHGEAVHARLPPREDAELLWEGGAAQPGGAAAEVRRLQPLCVR